MLTLTTATLRPGILATTYASFLEHLFGGTFRGRLALNIDCVGEPGGSADEVEEHAYDIFIHGLPGVVIGRPHDDVFEVRRARDPSLPRAWSWLFSRVRANDDFVLWLEDDWVMTRDVDLDDMTRIMRSEPRLALLRLSRFSAGDREARQWSRAFPRDGDVYRCPSAWKGHMGFSGNPSLIRGAFIREVRSWIMPWGCPEKQLKYPVHRLYGNQERITAAIQERAMRRILPTWEFAVYSKPGWEGTVKDIGERWRRANGIPKMHGRETW